LPIYEYRCTDGHTFEVTQSMTDEPVAVCQVCGKPVERVFHPVAVHFKGSGFYTTDYGRNRSGAGAESSKDESKSEAKETTGTKSESTPAKSSSDSD
jgi:putative FmdB family regulatory protein